MSKSHHPLPHFTPDMHRAEVMEVLYDICIQSGYLVTVSEFSAYCTVPGKRSFLICFESDRAAARFAQTHNLSVFGYSGVLLAVN